MHHREAPGFIGRFPASEPRFHGSWAPDERRTIVRPQGTVSVLGQCLAPQSLLEAQVDHCLASGQLTRLTDLAGSYLTLVREQHQLTVFVDVAGQFPLFYARTAESVVFGSDPASVVEAAGLAREPDLLSLSAWMLCPDVSILTEGRSALRGVQRAGGGEALRLSISGQVRQWTYEPLTPDPGRSFEECTAELRAALETAVAARAQRATRLTADFSGGMDSTSLAFLAARSLTQPLPVHTYHHPLAPAGDLGHAQHFAQLNAGAFSTRTVVGNGSTLTYRGLAQAPATSEPNQAAVSWARTRLRLERIAADGSDLHLTGEGADALLAAAPSALAGLVRPRSAGRLLEHSLAAARRRNQSPARVLGRALRLAATSAAGALDELAKHLENPADNLPGWLDAIAWWPGPGPAGSWLTRRARGELAALARAAAEDTRTEPGLGPADLTARTELRSSAQVQRQFAQVARTFGVRPQAPFLDGPVVRACLALPAHFRMHPSLTKPLLRAAMAPLVPAPVLDRQVKGDYSAEDYLGARDCRDELRRRVRQSPLLELGVIDPNAVVSALERITTGLPAPVAAFNRLLGVDLWLRRDCGADSPDLGSLPAQVRHL